MAAPRLPLHYFSETNSTITMAKLGLRMLSSVHFLTTGTGTRPEATFVLELQSGHLALLEERPWK